jgi:16S rRNA (guanine966-N2)-methyltransferase
MLASRLGTFEGLNVADIFAGSGALGFEALSRGAAFATFLENDPGAALAIRRNAAKLGATIELVAGSGFNLPRHEPFDLVFADPPYAAGSGTAVVKSLLASGWVAPGSWMTIETSRGDPVRAETLETAAERDIGPARLTLLRWP